MKQKTKRILAAAVTGALLAAVIAVILVGKRVKKDGGAEGGVTEVWWEVPYIYDGGTEPAYASCGDAFAGAIAALEGELAVYSGDAGTAPAMLAAWADAESTPTFIVAYSTPEGTVSFLVCKYGEGKLYKTYIETEMTALSAAEDVLLVKDTDVLAVRYETAGGACRQILYDFTDGAYAAVKDRTFEAGGEAEMDEALEEYIGGPAAWDSFYGVSVRDDPEAYLYRFWEIAGD